MFAPANIQSLIIGKQRRRYRKTIQNSVVGICTQLAQMVRNIRCPVFR